MVAYRREVALRLSALIAAVVLAASCADRVPNAPLAKPGDAKAMGQLLNGTKRLAEQFQTPAVKQLFAHKDEGFLSADERDQLYKLWAAWLDQDYAYRSFRKRFLRHWQSHSEIDARVRTLVVGFAAHAALVRGSLGWLEMIKGKAIFEKALNEASPEHGTAAGQFDRLRLMTALPHTAVALEVGLRSLRNQTARMLADEKPDDAKFIEAVQRTIAFAEQTQAMYERRGAQVLKDAVETVVFQELDEVISPLVTDIALWMGDTRLRKDSASLIAKAQVDALLPKMQPGDLVVERRNWYLSNLGLPGFWPHAELYIGTDKDLAAAFDADPSVLKAYGGPFTAHLQKAFAARWKEYVAGHEGEALRIVEAVSEGVQFSTATHGMQADYIGVMRPRLTALEKARAIERAWGHLGKPYDFDFDFQTQATLVCSEVVWASYQALASEGSSLDLKPSEYMGRLTLPPTDIVKVFDEQLGKPEQQLDFVGFLDGREDTKNAIDGTVAAFRASWQRAKWDISQD
ncbi:MAG: hypothetical protein EXR79_03310 [Myxococcales bacterium]|nr:hypothetical protein [Myxococcales bacterium]